FRILSWRDSQWRRGVAVLGVVVSLFAGTACSYSGTASSRTSRVGSVIQLIRHQKVLLLPPVEAGVGGWCIATKPGECSAARAFRGRSSLKLIVATVLRLFKQVSY